MPDIDRDLPRADGAVVGTVVASVMTPAADFTDGPPSSRLMAGPQKRTYVRPERIVKGDLPPFLVEISSQPDGGMCGIEARVGARIGVLLQQVDDTWYGSLCSTVDADELVGQDAREEPGMLAWLPWQLGVCGRLAQLS